jgi:DNA-binding response OmpR family regulator
MTKEPSPKTVLVVEDDAEVREVMAEGLALHGFTVLEATSGVEAFLHLRRARPGAAVLDLNMPRLGGLEALRWVRAFDPSIVVVTLSEEADSEVYWRALELGARDALPTPVVLADLVAVLESAERSPLAAGGLGPPTEPVATRMETAMPEVRVLVIADDPDIRAVLEEFLAARGYRTTTAPDDVTAVDAIVDSPPDAVLLDIGTAGLSELDALPMIRTLAPHTMVIMLGAITDVEVARRGLARGAFDFVVKPLDLDYLSESIEAAMTLRGLA